MPVIFIRNGVSNYRAYLFDITSNRARARTGAVLEAEYDHFYSRERNAFEDSWLICTPCHTRLTFGGEHTQVADAFNVYQGRAVKMPGVGTVDMFRI
jgi:hypothetical protein